MRRRGFTLLEILAVVTLMALAWSLLVGVIVTRVPATWEAVVASCRDADQRARLASRSCGPVLLMATDGGRGLGVFDARTLEPLLEKALPDSMRIEFAAEAETPMHVRFDATGQSGDYRVTLTRNDGVRVFVVSGVTGWWSAAAKTD